MIKNSSFKNIFLIILIAIFFLWPLFKPGFYESHDGEAHVARFAAYYRAFADGQFPPRWAGDLNYNYGTPLFNFFYPLPGYLGAFLYAAGITLEDSFKIIAVSSFILAPSFFYLWISTYSNKIFAFVSSLFYGLAPYHFLDLYVRGDIGEIVSFVFIPLVFWMIEKNNKKQELKYILGGGLFYALLILSHNAISLMFSPVFIGYILLKTKFTKRVIPQFLMFFLGLLLSSFFWLPALYEARYINSGLFANMFAEHFPTLVQLIYSPWGFGPNIREAGGLSPQVGQIHLVIVIISIITFVKLKSKRTTIGFWLAIFLFSIFMSSSLSSSLWYTIPILQKFQFPWRFVALASFSTAVLTYIILNVFRNEKFAFLLLVSLLFISINRGEVKGFITRSDTYYLSFPGSTFHHAEATTIWTAGDPGREAQQLIEVIDGEANVSEISRKSNRHTFVVNAKTQTRILDNAIYFPGWRVEVDGKKVPIEFQDQNHRGLITFAVSQGQHKIKVKFGESPIRLISDIISASTFIFVIVIFIFRKRIERYLIKI